MGPWPPVFPVKEGQSVRTTLGDNLVHVAGSCNHESFRTLCAYYPWDHHEACQATPRDVAPTCLWCAARRSWR